LGRPALHGRTVRPNMDSRRFRNVALPNGKAIREDIHPVWFRVLTEQVEIHPPALLREEHVVTAPPLGQRQAKYGQRPRISVLTDGSPGDPMPPAEGNLPIPPCRHFYGVRCLGTALCSEPRLAGTGPPRWPAERRRRASALQTDRTLNQDWRPGIGYVSVPRSNGWSPLSLTAKNRKCFVSSKPQTNVPLRLRWLIITTAALD